MKKSKKPTKGEAWLVLIIGLIMGTVFTFGTQYWNAPITPDEAEQVTATFSSYKETKRKSRIQEIILRFDDHEQLSIDRTSIDSDLRDAIREIEAGTTIEMLVHPNSNTILEMTIGNTKLLAFHESMQKLSSEIVPFMYLGIFCYLSALIGAGYLIFGKRRRL